MTTIAYDGKTISSDGLICSGNEITSTNYQKIFVDCGEYKAVAITGYVQKSDALIKWIASGQPETDDNFIDDYTVLLITDSNVLIEIDMNKGFDFKFLGCETPYSLGSGRSIALGAMKAGASPKIAVEIASKLDCVTGGRIVEYELFK